MNESRIESTSESGFERGDALLIVDVQNDFTSGGALAVPDGDAVIPVLNRWIEAAGRARVPVFASRCWHPPGHSSFRERGGLWPPHCVRGTEGAELHGDLNLPRSARIVSKGQNPDHDSLSAFQGTTLAQELAALSVRRIWVGGLALDHCVRASVLDARRLGFEACLILEATRAIDAEPGDGSRAITTMLEAGATVHRRELPPELRP